MIQLSFQPALDPFHAMFRILRLRPVLRTAGALETEHVRILDFYLAFPFRIKDMKVKIEHRKLKTAAVKSGGPLPYGEQPDDKIVLGRMEPIQEAALQTLAAYNLIEGSKLDKGLVEASDDLIPPNLNARVQDANNREGDLFELLRVLATDYKLTGPGGLKERSRLMEHRYDAV